MGIVGSYVMWTLPRTRWRHQADRKGAKQLSSFTEQKQRQQLVLMTHTDPHKEE
jgi:hypothetical protein